MPPKLMSFLLARRLGYLVDLGQSFRPEIQGTVCSQLTLPPELETC